MNFLEYIKGYCEENGMFSRQADEVVQMVIASPLTKDMAERWHDNVEDYPTVLLATIRLSVNRIATEYIEKNIPNAWFKPMFSK